jgi:Transposase
MKQDKYMGLDVHQAMTVGVVLDAEGRVILETMVPTEAAAIIRLIQSLSAPLHVTLEETTQAAWLWKVIRPFVSEVVVCDPRRNKLLSEGSKADKVDARKLADLLRTGLLRPVYHGHQTTGKLKELVGASLHWFVCRVRGGEATQSGGTGPSVLKSAREKIAFVLGHRMACPEAAYSQGQAHEGLVCLGHLTAYHIAHDVSATSTTPR